jgi:hypothetical protein
MSNPALLPPSVMRLLQILYPPGAKPRLGKNLKVTRKERRKEKDKKSQESAIIDRLLYLLLMLPSA